MFRVKSDAECACFRGKMADVSVQASVSKRDVATQTEHDTHSEAEQKDDTEYSSEEFGWEYEDDPDYDGPMDRSQPCDNVRGVSYSPNGKEGLLHQEVLETSILEE